MSERFNICSVLDAITKESNETSSLPIAFRAGLGSVAAVSSIGSAIELLSDDDWKEKYLMIEVMTCPGRTLTGIISRTRDCKVLASHSSHIFHLFHFTLLLDKHRRRLSGRRR